MALNVGQWLRKTPRPTIVLVDDRRIEVGNKAGKWQDLVRSIDSLGATRLACLDSAGNIIRAITLDDDDDDRSAKKPEETELQTFARLVADAYEKGSKSYAPLLENSMQFIERQAQRLAAAEREIERLRLVNAKLQAELIAARATGGDQGDDLVGALVAGIVSGQQDNGAALALKQQGAKPK